MSDTNTGTATPMPRYKCHKKVWALKISSVERTATDDVRVHFEDTAFAPREFNITGKPLPMPGWYMVQYDDGYVSFSPAKQFEEGYTRYSDAEEHGDWHGIGWAVKQMQNGSRVCRAGWNGKGMFVYLVPANSYTAQTDAARSQFGEMVPYRAYMALKTAQNDVVPWAPSQTDTIATDWEIAG